MTDRMPPLERLDDRPDWVIRATDALARLVFRATTRVRLEGLERLHGLDGPILIVANHVSNADAPLIGSFLIPALGRRIHWLGKQEALDWPILGRIFARNGVIGVRRGEADIEAFRAAKRVLDEGHVLCIFPEGTRSPNGALQEAKEGTAILALRTGARILPVGVVGTSGVWPRGRALPRPGGRVALRVGEPFTLGAVGTGSARRAGQQAATGEIMGRIAELLPPAQRGAYAADVAAGGSDGDPVR